jgi:hypothetical protein
LTLVAKSEKEKKVLPWFELTLKLELFGPAQFRNLKIVSISINDHQNKRSQHALFCIILASSTNVELFTLMIPIWQTEKVF